MNNSFDPSKLTLIEEQKPGFVKSDLESIYSTRSWEDMDKTRDQALRDYMAGVTEQITPATTTPSIPQTDKQNPYTVQADVLSSLNLLDENMNPTQTYTDYITAGGTPVPGYESEHENLLFLDRVAEKQKEVDQGSLTEDQMLWDLYANDILETEGYKTRSVGWWQSKYANNDFTNPLTNKYLQHQTLEVARQYHNALQAQQYAKNKTIEDSKMSALINKGDLTNEDIEQLFPELTKSIKETQSDTDYQRWFVSGRIDAMSRIYTADSGEMYYLHTNGELYKLSNEEKGPNIAAYTMDEKGQIKEISLHGGNDFLDFADTFKAGAASTVTGFVKLFTTLYGAAYGALDGDMLKGIENVNSYVDAFANDNLAWLTDSGYIDTDGFHTNDVKDWFMLAAQVSGAMAGGVALGSVAGKVGSWGTSLIENGHSITGTALKWSSSLYRRSTGIFTTGGTSNLLTSRWGPSLNMIQTSVVYALKDFSNTSQSLYQQKMRRMIADHQNGETNTYASNNDILKQAGNVAIANALFSFVFAGGADDNQVQRLFQLTSGKSPANYGSLRSTMLKYSCAFNTVGDYLDNFFTNYLTDKVGINEDGSLNKLTLDDFNFQDMDNLNDAIRTAVSATIQTMPTLQGQLRRRNIAYEQSVNAAEAVLKELNDLEKTVSPEHKATVEALKVNALDWLKNGELNDDGTPKQGQTTTDKAFYMLNKFHENVESYSDIVIRNIKKVADPEMIKWYQEYNKITNEYYQKQLKKLEGNQKQTEVRTLRDVIKTTAMDKLKSRWTSADSVAQYDAISKGLDGTINKLIDKYEIMTDSKKSTDNHKKILGKMNLTVDMLTNVSEDFISKDDLVKQTKLEDSFIRAKAQEHANLLNGGETDEAKRLTSSDVIASSRFIRLKNETNDREGYNAQKAALVMANEFMPHSVYKIDDNTYGIMAFNGEIGKLFTTDVVAKFTVGMYGLSKDSTRADAIELITGALFGDTEAQKITDGTSDKKLTRETLVKILQNAIDHKVLSNKDAAEFIIHLADSDNEFGQQLSKVFSANLDMGTLDKMKDLSELEKYTLLYASVEQLNNINARRFSGKTMAAEAIIQQPENNELLYKVVGDLGVDKVGKNFYEQVQKIQAEDWEKNGFPQLTYSLVRGLAQVVGEEGEINSWSDLKKELRKQLKPTVQGLARTADKEEVEAALDAVINTMEKLNKYGTVKFKGDTAVINLANWSNVSYRKMQQDVTNTPLDFVESKLSKDTFTKITERAAKELVDYRSADNDGVFVIKVNNENLGALQKLYSILKDGGVIADYIPEPQTLEDAVKILQDMDDEGFVSWKQGTEHNSNVLTKDEENELRAALKKFSAKQLLDIVDIINPENGKKIRYDYFTIVGSNIQINKVSSNANATRYRIPGTDIYLNPIDPDTIEYDKNGTMMFISEDTLNDNKIGRAGGQSDSIKRAKNVKAQLANVNKDFARNIIIDSYIDYIFENKDKLNIVIPKSKSELLFKQGITTDDGFFTTMDTPDDKYMRLVLKPDVEADDMHRYVQTAYNVNLFRILPFVSDEMADFSLKFLTPEGAKMQEAGINVPNVGGEGLTDYRGLYEILNQTFDFDQTSKVRTELFKEFFDAVKDGYYNPFSEEKYCLQLDTIKKELKLKNVSDAEAYKIYKEGNMLKGVGDIYYMLMEQSEKINNNYTDNANNEDYKLWLRHGNVLKKMIQHAEKGDADIDPVEIKNLYKDSTTFTDNDGNTVSYYSLDAVPRTSLSSRSFYGSPHNIINDTAISKQLLDESHGIDYRLVNEDGSYAKGFDDNSIRAAYEYVKDNIDSFNSTINLWDPENIVSNAWGEDNGVRIYRSNGATELWQILTAADGTITIEDLDKINRVLDRMSEEEYTSFLDALELKGERWVGLKDRVTTVYEDLYNIMYGKRADRTVINKQKKGIENYHGGASTSKGFKTLPTNRSKPGYKKDLSNEASFFVENETDKPKVTTQRLADAVGEKAEDFESKYLHNTRSPMDEFRSKILNQRGEIAVEDNADYRGQQLIDEISADVNLTKLALAAHNTYNSMIDRFELDLSNKDIEDNLADYSAMVTERMTGSKFLSTYAKFSFLDLKTGTEYANALYTRENGTPSSIDLFKTLFDSDKNNSDWVGKAYIEFDKKDSNGAGLDYSYKILRNEQDVVSLKNDVLLGVLKQNEWRLDNGIDTFVKEMSNDEQVSFVNRLISEGITTRDKKTILDSVLETTNINNFQYKMIPQPYLTDLNKNTIRDIEGLDTSAFHSTSSGVRKLAAAILFGIDYDGFDDSDKSKIDLLKTTYANEMNTLAEQYINSVDDLEDKIRSGKDLTNEQWKQYRMYYGIQPGRREWISDGIKKYIEHNFTSPEVLDYLFNSKGNRRLTDMYDSYNKGYDDATYAVRTGYDGEEKIININSKTLAEFFNEDSSYTGDIKKVIALDTEASNMKKSNGLSAESIKDLFQISFIVYERDDQGKLTSHQETYFIDHGGNEKRFEDWFNSEIDTTDEFYKTHTDYKEALEQYKNLSGIEENVKTEQQIADMLNGKASTLPDLLIAYNGDGFEFKVLKDILDPRIARLDALTAILKDEANTKLSLAQEMVYKRTFGDEHGDERHTADQDTRDMMDLLKEYFNSDNDLSYDRSILIRHIIDMIPEKYREEDNIRKILNDVDEFYKDNKDVSIATQREEVLSRMKDYTPTLDRIKELQRAYNYMMNDAVGNVFFKIREAMGYNPDNTLDYIVGTSEGKNNLLNVISTKMSDSNVDTPQAIIYMFADYKKATEDYSYSNFLNKVSHLDEETLRILGINTDRFNSEDVTQVKKNLRQMYSQGENGFKYGKITGTDKQVAANYLDQKDILPYARALESAVINNNKLFTEDDLVPLKALFDAPISVDEDFDIKDLDKYSDNVVTYINSNAERLLKEIKNILDGNKGTATFHAIYSFMDAVRPDINTGVMEYIDPLDPFKGTKELQDVKAGDIVLSEGALKRLLNVHDLKDLQVPGSKDLYLLSVTNPADNMNSLLPLRVRLIEGEENTVYFTPKTQEILRNRDFDGDHTMTTVLTSGMKPLAPLLNKYMFNVYSAYEDIYSNLRGKNINNTKDPTFTNMQQLILSSDDDVVKVSKEMDDFLNRLSNKTDPDNNDKIKMNELNTKLKEAIKNSTAWEEYKYTHAVVGNEEDALLDNLVDSIGFKQMFTNTGKVIRYVGNPSLFGDYNTYTNKSRKLLFATQKLVESNIGDPEIGWNQKKWAMENVKSKEIKQPLTDLYTPTIYLTSDVESIIDSHVTNSDSLISHLATVRNAIKKQIASRTYNGSYNEYKHYLDTQYKDLVIDAKDVSAKHSEKWYADQAKIATMQMLWDFELYTMRNKTINNQFDNVLKIVADDDEFGRSLEVGNKLSDLLTSLTGENHTIYGRHSSQTPLADMLLQDSIEMKYLDPEDKLIDVKDDISNGTNKVNVFFTKGLTTSPDSIFMTDKNKLQVAHLHTLPRDVDYGEGLEIGKNYGPHDILGTRDGKPYRFGQYFTVLDPRDKNGKKYDQYVVATYDSLNKKKITGQGFFKGEVGENIYTIENDKNNISLIVDIENATKKFNKYSHGFDYKEAFKNAEEVEYVIDGIRYSGYVLKDVPFNVIGDDTQYKQKLDDTDPNQMRSFEIMTSQGNLGLLNIGMYGGTVLKKDINGNLYLDFSAVSSALQSNNKDHSVVFRDAGNTVMYLRSAALARTLGEERFLGLVNQYAPQQFESIDDYLTNLKTSRELINSQETVNLQNAMIRTLGKEEFKKLYNTSDLTKHIFGKDIHTKLNPYEAQVFDDEFYRHPEPFTSKVGAKHQLKNKAKRTPGVYVSPSAYDIEDKNLIQSTLLHHSFDELYEGIAGVKPNKRNLIKNISDGKIGYARHFKGSANIPNDFTPVDTAMGTKLDDVIVNKNVVGSGTKSIISGKADMFIPQDTTFRGFKRGSGTGNVFEGAEEPNKPTFGTLVNEAVETGHVLAHADPVTRTNYILSLAYDKNKNSLAKIGALKGYEYVQLHNAVPQLLNKVQNGRSRLNYTLHIDNKDIGFDKVVSELKSTSKGYMLRKDYADKINTPVFTVEEAKQFRKSGAYEDYVKADKNIYEKTKEQRAARNKLIASVKLQNDPLAGQSDIKLSWDVAHDMKPWKDNMWSRSGINIDDENHLAVDIGIKNRYATSQYYQEEYNGYLNEVKRAVSMGDVNDFESYCKYRWLQASQSADPEGYEARSNFLGGDNNMIDLKARADSYAKENPEAVKAYENFVDKMIGFARQVSLERDEPFDSYHIFFAPFVVKNKQEMYNTIVSNIRTMMGINKYDPTSKRNAYEQNMMFDFFGGSEKLINDMSEAYAALNISRALLGENTYGKALIDNTRIVDAAVNFLTSEDTIDDLRIYNKFDSDISNEILNVVSLYTDLDVYGLRRASKNGSELLSKAYAIVSGEVDEWKSRWAQEIGEPNPSYTEVYKYANERGLLNVSTNTIAKKLADAMWAQSIIGQRIIECSPNAQKNFSKFLNDINVEGYSIVNKYGQKYKRGEFINPTTSNTMSHLKENVEIAYNSGSEAMWNQMLLEKALLGEIYLARNDMVDSLEKHAWTTKIGSRLGATLKKISTKSASYQMALPAKLPGRLMRFTAFDYIMGAIGNPMTIPNISRAAKELSAALQSNGASIAEGSDLYNYLMREGQPTYGRGGKRVDPINYTEEMGKGIDSKITDILTRPLDFQNHLGRYAIYLTALQSFKNAEDGKGEAWYGPLYYKHDIIDKIDNPEDKAMYVMDYMLGSPGGFPNLSKKTAGLMMYATFPMNLARTGGAYLQSMGKLFKEGMAGENNGSQWWNTVGMPAIETVGISLLSQAIISQICDLYGVDEEKEKEWEEEGVTLDPLGTLIGGTPSVVYDSTNPIYNLKEMFLNPFTNEYNDTLPKKAYGWIKANTLSRLNPAIKVPIEVVTGKDLWGDSAEGFQRSDSLFDKTKKHQYTTMENGMKKVMGYFVGSGIADNIIDEKKAVEVNPDGDQSMSSILWKGLTRGISSDLGNQKSYKKDTSNYYNFISDMKEFKKQASYAEGTGNSSNNLGYNYLDIEELSDADKLYYNRHYSNLYGTFDEVDYNRVNSTLKNYINQRRDASTIYAYIVDEYNNKHVSEATMRAALNSNSIIRKINQLKTGNVYINYLASLSAAEKSRLQSAIDYENYYYPILQRLFPDEETTKKVYIPNYQRVYKGGGSRSPSYSRPYTPKNKYYPGKYYPSTYKFNKKTGRYNVDWRRVQVNVSPQMAIWNQDKNLTQYDTGMSKKNDPRWLRSRDYVSRVYNI